MDEIPRTAEADTNYRHPRDCGFDRQCILGGAHLEKYGDPKSKSYTPAIMQDWCLRLLESQKGSEKPLFLYYASPIPHSPMLPTPLNSGGTPGEAKNDPSNFPYLIEYLDKQVGEIMRKLDELGMRKNTLIMFSGDNGTHAVETLMSNGKIIKGGKGSMDDTGSHVPLLASWPGVIAPNSVYNGLVDFTDIMPTCLDLAGASAPGGMDGVSFAKQIQGEPGKPREWVHALLVHKYFVRDDKWKLRENGELYDVSNAPYEEILVLPDKDTAESKAARERLHAVMTKLHPD
jgi:arylsulfatase A-like enzyme